MTTLKGQTVQQECNCQFDWENKIRVNWQKRYRNNMWNHTGKSILWLYNQPLTNQSISKAHAGSPSCWVRVYLPLFSITSGAISPCTKVCTAAIGKASVGLTWRHRCLFPILCLFFVENGLLIMSSQVWSAPARLQSHGTGVLSEPGLELWPGTWVGALSVWPERVLIGRPTCYGLKE